MEVTSTSAGNAGSVTQNTAEKAVVSSDFETFLRMLTAQIQNQDPLNPMDSSDYATQLATFSGVEQQVLTNDLLSTLTNRLTGSSMSDLAGWIGLEAQFGQSAGFAGQPLKLGLLQDPDADQSVLVVRDAQGIEVERIPVALTETEFTWTGATANGNQVPEGQYTFALENFARGALISTTPAQQFGTVVEARIDGGDTLLVLDSGNLILASDVSAIRQAR